MRRACSWRRAAPPCAAWRAARTRAAAAGRSPARPGVQFNRHFKFKARVRVQVKAGAKEAFKDVFSCCGLRQGLRHWLKLSLKRLLN